MSAEKEKIKGEYTGRWNARFTIKLETIIEEITK